MDAQTLEEDRCAGCVFMVATRDGPISMCVHNAKRDRYVLAPVSLEGGLVWDPLSGKERPAGPDTKADSSEPSSLPLKRLKGRFRAKHLAARQAADPTSVTSEP